MMYVMFKNQLMSAVYENSINIILLINNVLTYILLTREKKCTHQTKAKHEQSIEKAT